MPKPSAPRALPRRPLPPESRVAEALTRLADEGALQTLARGALPTSLLRRLLEDAMPRRAADEMPEEVWSALAAGIAAEVPLFGLSLAQALHDRLAWDHEPADEEEWDRAIHERPLEALWMAALSETRPVRRSFPALAAHCLEVFRASPACQPPSWEFVDGVLGVHAGAVREMRAVEKALADAERRFRAERQRAEDLREELKRLRREASDLRAETARAERKAAEAVRTVAPRSEAGRLEALERKLRKAEKESEHLRREMGRLRVSRLLEGSSATVVSTERDEGEGSEPALRPRLTTVPADPNPRRRVLRHILGKLIKKGKVGASHTHEDNVYRGLPDHEKGLAKAAMELLSREDLLLRKPTATETHVSLRADHAAEIRAIVAGEIRNPRLRRFVEQEE